MKGKILIALGLALVIAAGMGIATAQEPAQEEGGLKVVESAICTAVKDRTPEGAGTTFPADVGTLYCFTKIEGAKEETTVTHVWTQGENELASVPLKVGAGSWRTWSSKAIEATRKGAWKVEVKDADGNVLKTLNFTIE